VSVKEIIAEWLERADPEDMKKLIRHMTEFSGEASVITYQFVTAHQL
jgi:hypothetical protein